MSVPNGATLNQNNLDYLDNCIDYFENKDKIILAVDQDEAGMALQHEFIRRLGDENCYLVEFHDGNDANKYLDKYGPEEIGNLAVMAKPVPLDNVYTLKDLEEDVKDVVENGFNTG